VIEPMCYADHSHWTPTRPIPRAQILPEAGGNGLALAAKGGDNRAPHRESAGCTYHSHTLEPSQAVTSSASYNTYRRWASGRLVACGQNIA